MKEDLEQLFKDAMAWGLVWGDSLVKSACWNEERDIRAKMYAGMAQEVFVKHAIPTGKPIVVTFNNGSIVVEELVTIKDVKVEVK